MRKRGREREREEETVIDPPEFTHIEFHFHFHFYVRSNVNFKFFAFFYHFDKCTCVRTSRVAIRATPTDVARIIFKVVSEKETAGRPKNNDDIKKYMKAENREEKKDQKYGRERETEREREREGEREKERETERDRERERKRDYWSAHTKTSFKFHEFKNLKEIEICIKNTKYVCICRKKKFSFLSSYCIVSLLFLLY